jgi:hypothetical protein
MWLADAGNWSTLSAAIEVRRLFPGIADSAKAPGDRNHYGYASSGSAGFSSAI